MSSQGSSNTPRPGADGNRNLMAILNSRCITCLSEDESEEPLVNTTLFVLVFHRSCLHSLFASTTSVDKISLCTNKNPTECQFCGEMKPLEPVIHVSDLTAGPSRSIPHLYHWSCVNFLCNVEQKAVIIGSPKGRYRCEFCGLDDQQEQLEGVPLTFQYHMTCNVEFPLKYKAILSCRNPTTPGESPKQRQEQQQCSVCQEERAEQKLLFLACGHGLHWLCACSLAEDKSGNIFCPVCKHT